MRASVLLSLFAFLATSGLVSATPSERSLDSEWEDISSGESDVEKILGDVPKPGHQGVNRDSRGTTHAHYGNAPLQPDRSGGIPEHSEHTRTNQEKHPENKDALRVNRDSKEKKAREREALIGNKPKESGKARDHKPPHVQKTDGSIADRRARTTTKNLPLDESGQEKNLLGDARRMALKKGSNRKIKIHPNQSDKYPRPPSRDSLKSDPGARTRRPKPSGRQFTTPRKRPAAMTRSGLQYRPAGRATPRTPGAPKRGVIFPHKTDPKTGRPRQGSSGSSRHSPGSPTPAQRHSTLPLRPAAGNPGNRGRTTTRAPSTERSSSTKSRLPSAGPAQASGKGKGKKGKRDIEEVEFLNELYRRGLLDEREIEEPELFGDVYARDLNEDEILNGLYEREVYEPEVFSDIYARDFEGKEVFSDLYARTSGDEEVFSEMYKRDPEGDDYLADLSARELEDHEVLSDLYKRTLLDYDIFALELDA